MLPFIAINSEWRQIGLPVLYNTLYFREIGYISCNVDLHTSLGYRLLVRNVVVCSQSHSNQYSGIPNSLVWYMLNLLDISINDNESPPTLAYVVDAMPKALEKFVDMFPNVSSVCLGFKGSKDAAVLFSTSLVKKIQHQLISLHYGLPKLLDISFYPPQLTSFSCDFKCMSASQLPKINPYFLEDLYITNPPIDFPLLFTREPNSSSSVKFPNLKKLTLVCKLGYSGEMAESKEQAQGFDLQFPNLRLLGLVVNESSTALAFKLKTLPDHLRKVVLTGTNSAICQFGGKITANSIGHVKIHVHDVFEGDTKDFFKVTNRLLDQTKIAHEDAAMQITCSTEYEIDFEPANWKDISKLELVDPRFWYCGYLLQNLPSVKYFSIIYNSRNLSAIVLKSTRDNSSELNDKILECLSINNRTIHDSTEYIKSISMRLMKSLWNLKKVYISDYEASAVYSAFEDVRSKYPHFKNIKLKFSFNSFKQYPETLKWGCS